MSIKSEIKMILANNIVNYFTREDLTDENIYGFSIAVDNRGYSKRDIEEDFESAIEEINQKLEGFFVINPIDSYISDIDLDVGYSVFTMEVHGNKISLQDCKWCNGSGVEFQHYPCPDCQGGGYKGGMDAVELENRILSLYDME